MVTQCQLITFAGNQEAVAVVVLPAGKKRTAGGDNVEI